MKSPATIIIIRLLLCALFFGSSAAALAKLMTRLPSASECRRAIQSGNQKCNSKIMRKHCKEVCDEDHRLKLLQKYHGHTPEKSFYELSANDIYGFPIDFSDLTGKVILVTNVASYCGSTDQHYKELVELYEELEDSAEDEDEAFEIMIFPCNQFGGQEPDQETKIAKFCEKKGVEFTIMEKIDVNGANAHPVYKFLKRETNILQIGWNFATYFVIGPDGHVKAYNKQNPKSLEPILEAQIHRARRLYEF